MRGGVLAVSNFTLLADTRKGRRPAFVGAAPAEEAERLYEAFAEALEAQGCQVARGVFGADGRPKLGSRARQRSDRCPTDGELTDRRQSRAARSQARALAAGLPRVSAMRTRA